MLHPIPLLAVSYLIGGGVLDLIDHVTGKPIAWRDEPNALVIGAVATAYVAYVIIVTEILRDPTYRN